MHKDLIKFAKNAVSLHKKWLMHFKLVLETTANMKVATPSLHLMDWYK